MSQGMIHIGSIWGDFILTMRGGPEEAQPIAFQTALDRMWAVMRKDGDQGMLDCLEAAGKALDAGDYERLSTSVLRFRNLFKVPALFKEPMARFMGWLDHLCDIAEIAADAQHVRELAEANADCDSSGNGVDEG